MELKQTEAFRIWEIKLKDRRARTIIATRLMRLAEGLAGDVAPIGEGVSEPRIHYGPLSLHGRTRSVHPECWQ